MEIKRISQKKIVIKSRVPIYYRDIVTEEINIEIRYIRGGNWLNDFVFSQKRGNDIVNKLSQKYFIKTKNIYVIYDDVIEYEDAGVTHNIYHNILGFRFNDASWYRNCQLKKLLNK